MKVTWNDKWDFTKDAVDVKNTAVANWETVDLPHTWNGTDGQDGGNDYYRGTCYYKKEFSGISYEKEEEVYLEFEGVNSSSVVYVNGKELTKHDGGYSTFRVNITEALKEAHNEVVVAVDNAPNNRVYPQMADFTFYGGIYRTVSVITAQKTRFDLDYLGGPGIAVTPKVLGEKAEVTVNSYLTGLTGDETISYTIYEAGKEIAKKDTKASEAEVIFTLEHPHLWNGRKDPFLYTMKASLVKAGSVIDERETRFGVRSFEIDPEKGFILNGESYPLRGVSRHQDRPKIGNALKKEHHKEDIDLILEVGATTIRLAHYQHDQYFYDLCDETGLVIWAEIPYISGHMPTGRENTISQMKELIVQNYNHPSIVVWGLSNEITINGADDPDLIENHKILNDLCHEMDTTRLTTIAVVSMCDINAEYIQIPDVVSYNHYFGWYGGDTSMNGPFMDKFHATYPKIPIGMSEYGCEALNWHTSEPEQGDYTEEYQAYYHEELIKQLFTRPFIWATHVWNMFDFAADARSEGGEDGMNHKGLVTFDRKYKKDSFYAYKAWLSEDPFVHLCGKRYQNRAEDVTKVTIYSNLPEVELFANGESLGKQSSKEHFFYYQVPNKGETTLVVKAGNCTDESKICKVDVFDEAYRMKETGDVLNWFDISAPEGYFSILDKIGDIMENPAGQQLFAGMLQAVAENTKEVSGFEMTPDMLKMIGGFTVKRIFGMMATMGKGSITKEQQLAINAQLNQIKK